ncbi:MAG: class I SAM-dependent methyltransferase [Candidatus Izemoplasmatales bacterium]|jgi:16S rRNA (guanine1207-N2)-methyltransferase|nr:class I SAM-dependent methyltransferase [Candidatus Izemoplasmatales bacterium]
MSHYYTKENDTLKSNEKEVLIKIRGKSFSFLTDHGVFSKQGLDFGSRLLIEVVLDQEENKMLDVGCGYGPLGIIYKSFFPKSSVSMIDINERAIKLSQKNATKNKASVNVFFSDGFSEVNDEFNLIISNPPIRAGKDVVYSIFEGAKNHLIAGGLFYFVMNKKHGAPSAIKKCEEIFSSVEVVTKKSGYYIIKCIK